MVGLVINKKRYMKKLLFIVSCIIVLFTSCAERKHIEADGTTITVEPYGLATITLPALIS